MNKENYPLVLDVSHIAEILGISKRKAYDLMKTGEFPVKQIGKLKRVPKESFFEWLENQAS